MRRELRVLTLALDHLDRSALPFRRGDADLDVESSAPGAAPSSSMLRVLAVAGVMHEQHGGVEVANQGVAGVDEGFGIRRAVFIPLHMPMHGVHGDDVGDEAKGLHGLDHALQPVWPIQIDGVGRQVKVHIGHLMVVLPRGDASSKACMALSSQIEHGALVHLQPGPFWAPGCDVQEPVEGDEGFASARWPVDHHQGLLLDPHFDPPVDRGRLGAELVGFDDPVISGRGKLFRQKRLSHARAKGHISCRVLLWRVASHAAGNPSHLRCWQRRVAARLIRHLEGRQDLPLAQPVPTHGPSDGGQAIVPIALDELGIGADLLFRPVQVLIEPWLRNAEGRNALEGIVGALPLIALAVDGRGVGDEIFAVGE